MQFICHLYGTLGIKVNMKCILICNVFVNQLSANRHIPVHEFIRLHFVFHEPLHTDDASKTTHVYMHVFSLTLAQNIPMSSDTYFCNTLSMACLCTMLCCNLNSDAIFKLCHLELCTSLKYPMSTAWPWSENTESKQSCNYEHLESFVICTLHCTLLEQSHQEG